MPPRSATAGSLTLGLDSNSDDTGNGINAGYVVMNGGSLTVGLTGNLRIGQGNYLYNGVGTFTLNAGTVETLTGSNMPGGLLRRHRDLQPERRHSESDDYTTNISGFNPNNDTAYYIGQEGGTGTYNLTAGVLQTPWLSLGYGGQGYWCGTSGYRNAPLTNGTCPGWGYFNQSGGAVNAGILTVGGGWDSGGFGTYTITAGNLNATSIRLGMLDGAGTGCQTLANPTTGWNSTIAPVGTFNQDGGTVIVTQSLIVGSDLCNFGGYGGMGQGYYNLNGGTLTDVVNGVSQGANLIIRQGNPVNWSLPGPVLGNPAIGIFQGQGTVSFTGTLTNNGIVVANGGTLNLSSFSAVTENDTLPNVVLASSIGGTIGLGNSVQTNQSNGWYAVNGGAACSARGPRGHRQRE